MGIAKTVGIDKGAFIAFLALMLFFAVFLFYPILYVFTGAFIIDGRFSTFYFELMITDSWYRQALLNSFMIAIVTTLMTSLLSIPLAFLMVRCEFPGKRLFQGALLVPLVMPPFVGAIGMKQLFSRYGSVNLLLMQLGIIKSPIDWLGGGLWGIIILETLHLYPLLYLNTAAALANIDPTLEEQARNLGSSGFHLFRRIIFPLMLPGYLAGALIVFIWAFTDLGTPLIFDYRYVIPSKIYELIMDIRVNPMGYALTVLTLAVAVLCVVLSRRYGTRRSYEMLGRGHVVPQVRRLRGWRLLAAYLLTAAVVAAALTPQISVILTSLAEKWFLTILPETWTFRYYVMAFTHSATVPSILNSFFYSISSTSIDVLLGLMIGYLLARKKFPGKDLLDSIAMLPLALPGIVIAFGYLAAFSRTILDPFVNPVPLLILSYSVRRLPYSVRAAYAGFQQTSVSLEEASINLGASPARTLLSITLPLIMANVIAGGIMSFSAAMMEVSDSLVLATYEPYYPITKAIYGLNQRLADGPYIASALGMVGTIIVAISLLAANRLLGKSLGELFRA